MQKGFILCVDDQPEIVESLMTQLENAVGHLCEIEVAESAEEALNVLNDLLEQGERVEIVITDEIMPGMQGSKFLQIVHQLDPNIMTVMLTGQAGFDDVVYAVNYAELNKCIKKPWEYQDLKQIMFDLLEKAELFRKHQKLAQDVLTEKNKAEAIVQSITDGIIVVDGDDHISLVNNACIDILGRPEPELLGKRILDVIGSKELVCLLIEASQRSDEVISEEFVLARPADAGGEITVIAIARMLRDKYCRPIGVVTVLRDVTKEKEVSRMKANFLSTISHELRTPLTSILSTYELLLQDSLGELTEDQREFVGLSRQQGEFLSELIDNLIVLTNLEAHHMECSPAPIDMERLALEAVESAKSLALDRGLRFRVDIQPNLPKVIADESKIARVIKNLFSNAVKFTEEGEISLKIQRERQSIHLTLRDSGIGIAAQYFEKIFEKFFQVDASETREFGGCGVGLAICRAIVQAHHGTIWVESELDQGATFHVRLPVDPAEAL